MCPLLTWTNACSLDYSYLGAKRDSTAAGAGGKHTGTGSYPAGGTTRQTEESDGGASSPSSTSGSSGGSSGGSSASTFSGGSEGLGGAETIGGTTNETSSVAGANGLGGGGAAGASNLTGGNGGTHVGGTAGTSTTAPPPTSCKGCAVLEVPFTDRSQAARYFMRFDPSVSVNTRTTGGTGGATSVVSVQGTLTMRVFAPQLGNTQYQLLLQQASGAYTMCFSGVRSLPIGITAGWVTLEWSLGNCTADTAIGRLGLELLTSDATSDPIPSTTRLWLDSITLELNGSVLSGPFNFDTASSVNATPVTDDWNQALGVLYYRPTSPTPPTGTTISWLNN